MRAICLLLGFFLAACLLAVSAGCSAPKQSPSERLRRLLIDLQASGHDGAAAIATEGKTQNWIQFFLISKGRIHFDFLNHKIQPLNFSLNGPWQRIDRLPDLPYPIMPGPFSDAQIESLKRFLDERRIGYVYHRQVVFDDKRKPLAASESFQFDLQLTGKDDAVFLIEVFQVVYGHRPATLEVERLEIALD